MAITRALETGLRWGELAELRASDFNPSTYRLTVSRTVVELHPPQDGVRFVVKYYPKNAEYRHLTLSQTLAQAVTEHIDNHSLGPDDLLFSYPNSRLESEPTETNSETVGGGHGTMGYYTSRGCSYPACRTAYAHYRAQRRADGKDRPPAGRPTRDTDGHLPRDWFCLEIWNPTQTKAHITHHVRMHDLRHTNASWMGRRGRRRRDRPRTPRTPQPTSHRTLPAHPSRNP